MEDKKLTLAELISAAAQWERGIEAQLEENGGELPENFDAELSNHEELIEDKVQKIAFVITRMKTEEAQLKEMADQIAQRRKVAANSRERLENYLLHCMRDFNILKIEGLQKISLAKKPARVEILDEALLPESFVTVKTTTAPDKRAIADALKAGQDVPGAELIIDEVRLSIK